MFSTGFRLFVFLHFFAFSSSQPSRNLQNGYIEEPRAAPTVAHVPFNPYADYHSIPAPTPPPTPAPYIPESVSRKFTNVTDTFSYWVDLLKLLAACENNKTKIIALNIKFNVPVIVALSKQRQTILETVPVFEKTFFLDHPWLTLLSRMHQIFDRKMLHRIRLSVTSSDGAPAFGYVKFVETEREQVRTLSAVDRTAGQISIHFDQMAGKLQTKYLSISSAISKFGSERDYPLSVIAQLNRPAKFEIGKCGVKHLMIELEPTGLHRFQEHELEEINLCMWITCLEDRNLGRCDITPVSNETLKGTLFFGEYRSREATWKKYAILIISAAFLVVSIGVCCCKCGLWTEKKIKKRTRIRKHRKTDGYMKLHRMSTGVTAGIELTSNLED